MAQQNHKRKMLALSDHALSTSGVGTQSRFLFEGLIEKGSWTIRQFGAALKHNDYTTVMVNDDLIIKPIDGFGDRTSLRVTLATERPDVLFIFTDPRFFIWLFEMEDEIHQVCPVAWWHVWDNHPFPEYNSVLYESTDLINCHSYMTFEMLKDKFPDTTNFIPHAVPKSMYYPLPAEEAAKMKKQLLGSNRVDHFIGMWVNRNAKRKRPSDVLWAWKMFLDELEKKEGHRKATLIMHTDPLDQEGPNLYQVTDSMKISDNVFYSTERVEFNEMNILYNISDFCINISYAEGFGLSTLEAMQAGKPIIATKTGGLTRQAVDHRDGSENGVALPVEMKTIVGSQHVPYIYEDYVSCETAAKGIMKLYSMPEHERKKLSEKVISYAHSEFAIEKTIDDWNITLNELLSSWKYQPWECRTF